MDGPAQKHFQIVLHSWHKLRGKQKAIPDFHLVGLTHENHMSLENSSGAGQPPDFTSWAAVKSVASLQADTAHARGML